VGGGVDKTEDGATQSDLQKWTTVGEFFLLLSNSLLYSFPANTRVFPSVSSEQAQ